MILHTLNAAPSSAAFRECVNVLQNGDAVVLLGDGVYAALDGTRACEELCGTGAEIFLLGADARLGGVSQTAELISWIGIEDFVVLTERFRRQLAWY